MWGQAQGERLPDGHLPVARPAAGLLPGLCQLQVKKLVVQAFLYLNIKINHHNFDNREYGQPCPGPGERDGEHVIDYLGRVSEDGHEDDYPLNYIEETVELPCSQVGLV